MIRQSWWKYLGALLIIYVIIVGLLTPMKPGVYEFTPINTKAGKSFTADIITYNTHYKDSSQLRAWLKIDTSYALLSSTIEIQEVNKLKVTFDIPNYNPSTSDVVIADLVIDEKDEHFMVLPQALYITQDSSQVDEGALAWSLSNIENLSENTDFTFPFRWITEESMRNLFFHVSIWFAMFILLIIGIIYAIKYLLSKDLKWDIYSSSLTHVAIVFGIIGMLTGSFWAKFAWGQFWINDPKLNMSAVALLIYLAYWVLRVSITDQDVRARVSAAYSLFAFAALIPLVFVLPRMMDSMHPGNGGNPAFGKDDLDNTMRMVFYPAIIGFTLLGLWISSLYIRFQLLWESYMIKRSN